MKSKDLKEQIKSSFIYDCPDTIINIKDKCKYTSQIEEDKIQEYEKEDFCFFYFVYTGIHVLIK